MNPAFAEKDLTFEVIFSVKSDKPEYLEVKKKQKLTIKQSDWDTRGEFVKATDENGTTGLIPSTHVKRKK